MLEIASCSLPTASPRRGCRTGEEFGDQGLIASARQYAAEGPRRNSRNCFLVDVKQFCAFQLQDDATLIVISALPVGDHAQEEKTWRPAM